MCSKFRLLLEEMEFVNERIVMSVRKIDFNHTQLKLFSALFADAANSETQETMEFPFLCLSKKPRFRPIEYTSPTGEQILVTGGEPYGIANIWDWDLMIWLLSQIREGIKQGEIVSRKLRFSARVFLKTVRRADGGSEYRRLEKTLERLKNTNVKTTIRAKNGKSVMFSWVEYLEMVRDEAGRLQEVIVVIPEWLFEAVSDNSMILTLHPDYFLLKGGLERWLYRLARKQAGNNKDGWSWKMRALHERSGTTQRFGDFARDLRRILGKKNLLGYHFDTFEKNREEWVIATKVKQKQTSPQVIQERSAWFLSLKTPTYETAKSILPGRDIYALEQEWKKASSKNQMKIYNPDRAFIAWCKAIAFK